MSLLGTAPPKCGAAASGRGYLGCTGRDDNAFGKGASANSDTRADQCQDSRDKTHGTRLTGRDSRDETPPQRNRSIWATIDLGQRDNCDHRHDNNQKVYAHDVPPLNLAKRLPRGSSEVYLMRQRTSHQFEAKPVGVPETPAAVIRWPSGHNDGDSE
jgi:hypothetical protein